MRILIATVTAGAGHVQAAAAMEEAWKRERPRDTVQRLDVLEFTSRLYRKAYSQGYVKFVERAPELYGMMFRKTDNPAWLNKLTRARRLLARAPAEKFVKVVREFNPDIAICTHFMPPEIFGNLRNRPRRPLATKVVTIVTDFEAHALWMENNVDLYCVAAEETKARLVARGLPADHVLVTGIPIAAKFGAPVDGAAVRKQMGLRDDLPVLLVLSGGFGMGPVAEILNELNQLDNPIQVLVVCGRNEELRRELATGDYRHPTRVLGFCGNMQELMAISQMVITKPGGLTTSESLALGKPLLILNPIPGQEAANSDFLLEHGAAVKINRVEDLPSKLARLLGTPKLVELAQAAQALGRPHAAADIVREVVKRFGG
ncbi:MAG: glycosyltransferase [Verrucomicrobiota bacterium]